MANRLNFIKRQKDAFGLTVICWANQDPAFLISAFIQIGEVVWGVGVYILCTIL